MNMLQSKRKVMHENLLFLTKCHQIEISTQIFQCSWVTISDLEICVIIYLRSSE